MTKIKKKSVQTPWSYGIYTLSVFLELLDGVVHCYRLETGDSIFGLLYTFCVMLYL